LRSSRPSQRKNGDRRCLDHHPTGAVQFDIGALPVGTASTDVAKATLTVWVNQLVTTGGIDVYRVAGPWTEAALTNGTAQ